MFSDAINSISSRWRPSSRDRHGRALHQLAGLGFHLGGDTGDQRFEHHIVGQPLLGDRHIQRGVAVELEPGQRRGARLVTDLVGQACDDLVIHLAAQRGEFDLFLRPHMTADRGARLAGHRKAKPGGLRRLFVRRQDLDRIAIGKLGASLGRDGDLPRYLAKGAEPDEVPRRSLMLSLGISIIFFCILFAQDFQLLSLIPIHLSSMVAIYVLGMTAAVLIFPRWSWDWWVAVVALAMTIVLLILNGPNVLFTVGVAIIAVIVTLVKRRLAKKAASAA